MDRTRAWLLAAVGTFVAVMPVVVLVIAVGKSETEVASGRRPTTTTAAPTTTTSAPVEQATSTTVPPAPGPGLPPPTPTATAPGFVPLEDDAALATIPGCRNGGCRVVDRQEPVTTGRGPASFLMVFGPPSHPSDVPLGVTARAVYFLLGDGTSVHWSAAGPDHWLADPLATLLGPDGRVFFTTFSGAEGCCQRVHAFE